WYGQLVGGYFNGHPKVQEAALDIVDKSHVSTAHLPERWMRTDEWYNYKDLNPGIKILALLDESTYEGGTHGEHHPISWYHEFDGGRAFYTGGGHTKESYQESDFIKHLFEGIIWAAGSHELYYSRATSLRVTEENRFLKVELSSNLDEPTELAVMKNGKVLIIERKGTVKLFNPETRETKSIGRIPVNTTHEDGLMGVALDPDFETNDWVYLYFSPQGPREVNRLSRFNLKEDILDNTSEVTLLEVNVQRKECCHTGGSLAFDQNGNLYISTGDNTNPFASHGY